MLALLLANCASASAQENNDADTTNKKKERTLTVYCEVMDHLTHFGIDSTLKCELVSAVDGSFVDTASVNSWTIENRRHSEVYVDIKKTGHYALRISAIGYATKDVPFSLEKFYKHETYRQLKPVYLQRTIRDSDVMLDDVVVTATRLKFYVKGDTLVYDADAFALAEGSMLNTLIKALPGVELKEGGEIYQNGRKVESLLLDGKDFFDDNKELLLENMPAYTVKNITTYERVPIEVRGTNREKATEKELVMDVRLKREYHTGWMSNVELGAGMSFYNDDQGNREKRYSARSFAMRHSDRSRLMLAANINNLNDQQTPGETGEWTPANQATGLSDVYKLNADYTIGDYMHIRYHNNTSLTFTDQLNRSNSNSEIFLDGENNYGRSFSNNKKKDFVINTDNEFSYRNREPLNWCKSLYANFNPRLYYSHNSNDDNSASATLKADVASQLGKEWKDSISAPNAGALLRKYALNRYTSILKNSGHWTQGSAYGYMSITPPHNDMLDFGLNMNCSFTDYASNQYSKLMTEIVSNASVIDQNRYVPGKSHSGYMSLSPNVSFTLAHSEKVYHSLNLSSNTSWRSNESDDILYMLSNLENWDDDFGTKPSALELAQCMDKNSSRMSTNNFQSSPQANYNLSFRNDHSYSSISFSASYNFVSDETDYWRASGIDTSLSRKYGYFSPHISFYHSDHKRGRHIQAYYYKYQSAPSLTNLLQFVNDSDPLNIYTNNPDLRNTTYHNLNVDYRDKFGGNKFLNTEFRLQTTDDVQADSYVYDMATGIRTHRSENVDGNWQISTNIGYDFPVMKDDKLRIKTGFGYQFINSVGLYSTDESTPTKSEVANNYCNGSLNLTFQPNMKFRLGLNSKLNYQHSDSQREKFETIEAWEYNYGATAFVALPWDMELSTDITMYSRRGYSYSDMNDDELIWNARLTRKFLSGKLNLRIDAFDILHNLTNVRTSITAQGRVETFNNVVPSYGMVSLSWRIDCKKKKKEE